jgi:hypothetical protein
MVGVCEEEGWGVVDVVVGSYIYFQKMASYRL